MLILKICRNCGGKIGTEEINKLNLSNISSCPTCNKPLDNAIINTFPIVIKKHN